MTVQRAGNSYLTSLLTESLLFPGQKTYYSSHRRLPYFCSKNLPLSYEDRMGTPVSYRM